MYNIQTQQFQGPFGLLLELIEEKKLSINEISLAEIADQYINYLKEIEHFPTKEVAYFVVVAATLMLIKSRSLMPSLKFTEEEEMDIQELESQLKIYKYVRAISGQLEKIFGKKVIFTPQESRILMQQTPEMFTPSKDLSLNNLKTALEDVLGTLIHAEKLPEKIVKKTITLEEKIIDLAKRLEERMNLCFSELHESPECKKIDLIVSFLALLELTKRQFIIVKQDKAFGEIHISKN